MSCANQALTVEYLLRNRAKLEPKAYRMPLGLDRVAELGLEASGTM